MVSNTAVPTNSTTDVLLPDSDFHNPKLVLQNSAKQKQVNKFFDQFVLTRFQLNRIRQIFLSELEQGLSTTTNESEKPGSLLMINTFVPSLQTVNRKDFASESISLDIGSTNFRVLYTRIESSADGNKLELNENEANSVCYYDIPVELRRGTGDRLFDFLAQSIEDFVDKLSFQYHKMGQTLPLGFTFSFPMEQQSVDSGLLKVWTKNFDLPDAIGQDVGKLLQSSLNKRGNRFNIKVVAVINDSTGTLIKGWQIDPDCAVGVILGSGHNACYLERVDRVQKWAKQDSSNYSKFEQVLVNTECGAFGDNGSLDFVRTKLDQLLDQTSLFPGSFTYEKYFSGYFMGELLRYVMLELTENRLLFNGVVSNELKTKNSVPSSSISNIERDSSDKEPVLQLLRQLGYDQQGSISSSTSDHEDDIAIIRYACSRLTIRAASMLAASLSVLIERAERPRTVVAIDGSLFKHHPKMRLLMTDFIEQLVKPGTLFQLILADDGSGKGSGILAAFIHKVSKAD